MIMQSFATKTFEPVASRTAKLALTSFALLLAAGFSLQCDVAIARWVKADGVRGLLADVVRLSEVFSHGLGVLLVVFAATAIDARGWRIAPRLLLGAYVPGLIANLFKLLLFRVRPEHFDLQLSVLESFRGLTMFTTGLPWDRMYQSFPSAHTATATGLAIACSRLFPRATWFFILMACLCGLQRLESSAHFLSDVLAGAALGFASAVCWEWPVAQRWFDRWESTLPPQMN